MGAVSTAISDDSGISITSQFSVSRDVVWRAWTEPEPFAQWFGGPLSTVPLNSVSLDVVPAGEWRATMILPDGHEIPWRGQYREVEVPHRLILSLSDLPGDAAEVATIEMTEVEDETTMVFHQTGGNLTADEYAAACQGWVGFFDHMADVVTRA